MFEPMFMFPPPDFRFFIPDIRSIILAAPFTAIIEVSPTAIAPKTLLNL